jgi:S-adenosylmethionine/arginine decarboxylase-like enzyme
MTKFWGYHLMLDCAGLNTNITNKETIQEFLRELVKRIDMVAYGDPTIEYLLPDTDNAGYSVVQLITTSNICIHFVDSNSTGYFDIFSCKEFDTATAISVVNEYFAPTSTKINFITRNA